MRLRNIPGADRIIAESPYCISSPIELKGRWQTIFPRQQPIHLEIGMGKGRFLTSMAAAHPNINYLGMEKYSSVLLRAVQKIEEDPMEHVKLLCFPAEEIEQIFAEDEIDRIYLNFSDPWPKDRHAKRRLTSAAFLERYSHILSPKGHIEFKTDNQDLFSFSVNEIQASSTWKLDAVTYDLHHDSAMFPGNIMTEYEERFSSMGNPICKLICSRSHG